jgi:hypothetical protein
MLLFVLFYVFIVCKCVLYYCHRVTIQLELTNITHHIPQTLNSHKINKNYIDNALSGYGTCKAAVDCENCKVL